MTDTDLTKFQGKRVLVQVKLDQPNEKGETLIEVEGKAEAANALGILLKPKGRTQVDLIEADKIESVELAPDTEKKLAARTISNAEYGKARQHLLDRHGCSLEQVNALNEDQAFSQHQAIDHKASGLGHVHGEKKAAEERAEALEKAAADESTESAA